MCLSDWLQIHVCDLQHGWLHISLEFKLVFRQTPNQDRHACSYSWSLAVSTENSGCLPKASTDVRHSLDGLCHSAVHFNCNPILSVCDNMCPSATKRGNDMSLFIAYNDRNFPLFRVGETSTTYDLVVYIPHTGNEPMGMRRGRCVQNL